MYSNSVSQQRVLRSNKGYMMAAGTVITLSETLSSQSHGIVLHWQGYSSEETQNGNHSYQYIPRKHADFGGRGVGHTMSISDGTIVGCKYIYVTDTTITGHANNNSSSNRGGITFANNCWVPTQIIGC